jgi:hypothetical protein
MCQLLNHTGHQLVTDEPHYTTKTWEKQKLLQNFTSMVQQLKCEFWEYGNLFLLWHFFNNNLSHSTLFIVQNTYLPTCTVFTSLQDHSHANEDFCKTTKHMAYQNLLISFIWPTRMHFKPPTSIWHTKFAAYMWNSSCLLLVSHCPQCSYFKLCLLNIGTKYRHFKNSLSSMQILENTVPFANHLAWLHE